MTSASGTISFERALSSGNEAKEPLCAHLLPCAIKHNGPAPVSQYFQVERTEFELDGAPVLSAAFRGRDLKGARLPFPEGYKGCVLSLPKPERNKCDENAQDAWIADNEFTDLTYWNHDTVPTSADPFRRAMGYAKLAPKVHSQVPLAALEAMQQRLAQGPFQEAC
mmetsp:Transcript_27712/g.46401  ORF Transcript_27712/g.46401 Transcript_27712/m.46401 type:complete len:166 (+) Transcript_27712:336-833(+)|eukprot:CAMPEP_0198211150 /NCGR_PEP_ID=MMETSP1445-20131203/22657_1 /TAXON_ID=36898 /ORGANISM="Pyramimonas sp., Strain CCMP2087" /LENGTH=165 /DNA_ID=CAMNT_0043885361 /DNA_START=329 /DNA_END=826 /DNA_ORIENTATION=-